MEKVRDRLLNIEQVRKILNCSRSHVYSLIESRHLAAIKIGNRQGIRIKESALDLFIEKRGQDDAD